MFGRLGFGICSNAKHLPLTLSHGSRTDLLHPAQKYTNPFRHHYISRSHLFHFQKRAQRPFGMASLVEQQHEWSATRVRQTFLDYFKGIGHTFGRLLV